ncbi:Beta-galactosidase, beta-sandwich domain [Dillenia turbinata]|uniref:Beta-galactosidase n=1 Tax=Dillenia turbinata TaxID=194707 RepID=A0AAN8V6Q6_9MAGN
MSLQTHMLILIIVLFLLSSSALSQDEKKEKGVTYDGRSLIINGKRELLFSGSVHYPRASPEMWQGIFDKAKEGGINVIQTYYNFEGNYDLVKFIKMIGDSGLYATLRLGPFIQAEWNYGYTLFIFYFILKLKSTKFANTRLNFNGLPIWLRDVQNITFRTNSEPFKYHMEKFVKMIIDKMKDAKLFAPQGGPIILAQIENEYNTIQPAFEAEGSKYIQWAGKMAVGLNAGVPWMMCKQTDAPDPVINACNGRHCGDTFAGPNKPYKPSLWTENWTAQFRVFGDPPSQRSAEDLAFSTARFFSKDGSLANYYMYFGGTNFGRTAAAFVTTRYYDEAPLDEYGLRREPKWGHLRDLHTALKLSKKALLWGSASVQILGKGVEAQVYEKSGSNICAAFLCNNNSRDAATVTFRGSEYYLPRHSISILPDCKTVVYNTQTTRDSVPSQVVAQHNVRTFHRSKKANKNFQWQMAQEKVPTYRDTPDRQKRPQELIFMTKDTSDYLWYTTRIELEREDLPFKENTKPVLEVANLGHAMHTFVNGEFVGTGHGSKTEKSFVFTKAIPLKIGTNEITLLGMTMGLPDSGVYLERRMAGVHTVALKGLMTGTLDITQNGWGHKVGIDGEKLGVYTQEGSQKVKWKTSEGRGPPLTWYKAFFDEPEGQNPVVIELSNMSKGMAWVNGKSIGRYWTSFLSPLGQPSQAAYHIPRSYMKPTENLLVLFEEIGGNPEGIQIQTVTRDIICSIITENHPARVKSWERKDSVIHSVDDTGTKAHLECPKSKVITKVHFASYGNPIGVCGQFVEGDCKSSDAKNIVEQYCVGKQSCEVPFEHEVFDKGNNLCPDVKKTLAIQVKCGRGKD